MTSSSLPPRLGRVAATWASTTFAVARDADHFLGTVEPIASNAIEWIQHIADR